MSVRFRKSKTILPGVKVNVTKTGIGVSAGVKGARVSAHSSGRVSRSIGIPGTGLYDIETKNIGKNHNSNDSATSVTTQSSREKSGKGLRKLNLIVAIICFVVALLLFSVSSIIEGIILVALGGINALIYYSSRKKESDPMDDSEI